MQKSVALLQIKETSKTQSKSKKSLPTISRTDIMYGLLSNDFNELERSKLSNLYAEITYMEKKELKYISEIAVSCQSDVEIYEMIKRVKKTKKLFNKKENM